MTYANMWELDSGLRENMDLTVDVAYFAPSATYQDGKALLLMLKGHDEEGEPAEVQMSVGADWTTADGGRTITHLTKRKINKNTIYGHFIQHALQLPNLAPILLNFPGGPLDASIWQDLVLRLKLTEISFGRNLDPVERLMPVEFLGKSDQPSLPLQSQVTPPQPLQPQPAPATVDPTVQARIDAAKAAQQQTNGSPLYNQLVEMAKSSADFNAFVASAFAIDGVLADPELANQVADQTMIWAVARS